MSRSDAELIDEEYPSVGLYQKAGRKLSTCPNLLLLSQMMDLSSDTSL
jgi:hypothetical protein